MEAAVMEAAPEVAAPEATAAAEQTEDEALMERAQRLMSNIIATESNPNPRLLHALASMLESQEDSYMRECGGSPSNHGRESHIVARLGSAIRENDEFYELISSKFLSDNRYSLSVRAAAARILINTSSLMHPHVFDDAVLDNIKSWVIEDNIEVTGSHCDWKHELGRSKPTDVEMLKTYATGLLAMSLAGGLQVVEDIVTSGLSGKLMRYLRTRIFGEVTAAQKDTGSFAETKHCSATSSVKGREENRGRSRQALDSSRSDAMNMKFVEESALGDQSAERGRDRGMSNRNIRGGDLWEDGRVSLRSELTDSSSEVAGAYEIIGEDADIIFEGLQGKDLGDGKTRHGVGRITCDEDADENTRDDSSRRRANRGMPRTRGKGRSNESAIENERTMTSPSSTLRPAGPGRASREKNLARHDENKRILDTNKNLNKNYDDTQLMENDDRLKDCCIGSRDISDIVAKAIRAAEDEARAANAPAEAIKAVGDAAAENVKSAALEAWKSKNDEEAAVLAASEAASKVVDAAVAIELSRSSIKEGDASGGTKAEEPEPEEVDEEFFIVDNESLAHLRDKYSIQCLEILGDYVEALGPILKEKGVDVCLALLQLNMQAENAVDNLAIFPELLKLICVLANHRKFAALFVDRGGMQRLIAVPRVSQAFFGLASCLFTIGSQGIMERVCALPSELVYKVVQLGLQLLECSQDQARKHAAIFFASAFVFRAILEAFDAQDGLHKMLNLLHGAASVRSGGNSGGLGVPNAPLRNDRSPAEVLTASEKQIAYHTCVALRQYFRAQLLLLVDSLRPNKSNRGVARSNSSVRAAYKPLDISNEAMDAVFLLIQRDRKVGPAFVRARWPAVDKFLLCNGHIIMLELCQAPPVERYLHDLAQYALGVLHIVSFVPYSRKLIVNATLSNDRVGMAVILHAASCASYVDPEVIQPALNLLVNLVCPPPSISNKPSVPAQGQHSISVQAPNGMISDKERNLEKHVSDRSVQSASERSEPTPLERGGAMALSTSIAGSSSQVGTPLSSGVVGDRRISLGPGSGCSGLAAQLEQGYRQAREAVRANNGIKVLLHLLDPRVITPPAAVDCLRALACRVLLGLARDEAIAHILTKLQVGKKLSELIRDSGGQASNVEQGRWQSELTQVAMELIGIITNSGHASTLVTTDAAAPTLKRIERAAIAAATPITYHSRELLQLIHEYLQASGFTGSAEFMLKEAGVAPLPSFGAPLPPLHHITVQESSSVQHQWPSGRAPSGFLTDTTRVMKHVSGNDNASLKSGPAARGTKKKPVFSSSLSMPKNQVMSRPSSFNRSSSSLKSPCATENTPLPTLKSNTDIETLFKSPIMLPMKRKLTDFKDGCSESPSKRLATSDSCQSPCFHTPIVGRRTSIPVDTGGQPSVTNHFTRDPYTRTKLNINIIDNADEVKLQNTPGYSTPTSLAGVLAEPQSERMTLDSIMVQYLKHQHRQCPAPITTLPPLSLLHPHVCPEASHGLEAPANVTARISTREFRKYQGGMHSHRMDRQFVYSRFRPFRTCRDDSALLSCITFLGSPARIATGTHSGEIKIFDSNNGDVLESDMSHESPVTLVQCACSGERQLLLSSSPFDVRLWDASSISGGPLHTFDGCKTARFSHSGTTFAAFSTESSRREVLLYDIQTYNVELKLSDSNNSPGSVRGPSLIHFSPSDMMLLWNGVLWDRRSSELIHRFDQFTDYGGGGFHPAGNEVILNSEVWDLRKFKLLRSVPSLDQTVITFNSTGDVIYAILRRNLEDITSAVQSRRVRHPLFQAFRTIDAVNYSEIATIPVDRCVLDFAADPTDSYVGVVAMDDHDEMYSSARLYEIGRRRPTDDDSDPDDGADSDEEDDEDDESAADVDQFLGTDMDGDSDSEDFSNLNDEDDIDSGDDADEDGGFNIDFDGGDGILDIVSEGDEDEDDDSEILESFSSGDEGDFDENGFVF